MKQFTEICFSDDLVPSEIFQLQKLLKTPVYLVGGRLTSYLLKKDYRNSDIDLTCSLTPEQIKLKLKDSGISVYDTGIEHFTLTLRWESGISAEITTFRSDVESINHRKAKVKAVNSLEKDLQRRDFSITSFALSLVTGKVFCPSQRCIDDLQKRIIRFTGNPFKRVDEDYLRVFRAPYLAAKYDCEIHWSTKYVCRYFVPDAHKNVATERITALFSKSCRVAPKFLRALDEIWAVRLIFPPINSELEPEAHIKTSSENMMWTSLYLLTTSLKQRSRLSVKDFCKQFKLSNRTARYIEEIAIIGRSILRTDDRFDKYVELRSLREVTVFDLTDFYPIPYLEALNLLSLSETRPLVAGEHLRPYLKPGFWYTPILNSCMRMQLNDPQKFSTVESLLAEVFTDGTLQKREA